MTRLLRRLRYLIERDRCERELDDELQFHLEMKRRELASRGLDRAAATLAARRSLGNLLLTRDHVRDVWIAPWLQSVARELRHALRELRRSRRFTVFAGLTLAVGMGAAAAVFAVLDVIVLRPLPYAEPEGLMAFRSVDQRDERPSQLSYPNFIDSRERNRVFDHLVSYRDARFTLGESVPPVPVAGQIVSWDLFPLLGIQPALGRGFRPGDRLPRLADAVIDSRVLAFSAVLVVLTSVLFGLAPALRAASTDPAGAVREVARSVTLGRDRFRSVLVVGQVALALMLLVGANLLMSGLLALTRTDPGFRPDHLVAFDITTAEPYTIEQEVALSDRVLGRMAAVPGVSAAAAGSPLPLQGHVMRLAFDIETRPMAASARPRSDAAIVTPGYFAAMGIPLLAGRDFNAGDDAGTAPVLVVNRAFQRRFFPGEEVVGKRIRPGAGLDPVMREIVGVVGDARQTVAGTDADPIYYFPYEQLPWRIGTIVLRTSVPPLSTVPAVRQALGALNQNVTMQRLRTGEQLAAAVVAPARFLTVLMGTFAGVALLLTVAGLYGVLSYMVARRRHELGVRIALGAGRTAAVRIVSRRAVLLVLPGVIVGAAGSFLLGRLLGSMVFGVPADLGMVVAGAGSAMAVTGLAAAVVPAARAASIHPVQVLRAE